MTNVPENLPTSSEILASTTAIAVAMIAAGGLNRTSDEGEFTRVLGLIHAGVKAAVFGPPEEAPAEPVVPAVPVKKSITPDFLISLEDGRRYKSLKRHLSGRGLTPDAYRRKYGLASDYPMTAPNYAKQRSELAKQMGLGKGKPGR